MEHKDRTIEEAKKYYGEELYKQMCDTNLLDGITAVIKKGKMYIYGCDLENAYNKVKTGKHLFID